MELVVAVISGLLAALVIWWRSSSSRKYPPGPWGLPIVGYLPFLGSRPYLTLSQLAKRYGSVFSLRLGTENVVVLNDYKSTKEAFHQDESIGRPPQFPFQMNQETIETGAFFGIEWKEQRRHCLHMLKNVGFGRSNVEQYIQEEINDLLDYLEKNEDIPFCISPRLTASMTNNIASLVFGKRLKYEDPVRTMLTESIIKSTAAADQTGWLIFFPMIKNFFDRLGAKSANEEQRSYALKEIEEHEKTLDPSNIRDFIDGYLVEIEKRKNDPTFIKPVLQDMVAIFFAAGSETVRHSVGWMLLIAASDQKAQRRIQGEIQEVTGNSRMPVWPDHSSMPYTDAFIMETMRWRTLVPINLLRQTIANTEINGYFIPKGTLLLNNLYEIHHDREYWGPDVDEFRPERFLTEDGKEVKKWERYCPFSIGKRACPGEPLAKVEIFLYFASILQKFDVKIPDGKVADLEGAKGVTLTPKPQDLVFTKRN